MDNYLPDQFEIFIGDYWGPSYKIKRSRDDRLEYLIMGYGFRLEAIQFVYPDRLKWEMFWHEMELLGAWNWSRLYNGPLACNGTHWYVEIEHNGKKLESSGDNILSDAADIVFDQELEQRAEKSAVDFDSFLITIEKLLGGRKFC